MPSGNLEGLRAKEIAAMRLRGSPIRLPFDLSLPGGCGYRSLHSSPFAFAPSPRPVFSSMPRVLQAVLLSSLPRSGPAVVEPLTSIFFH